MRSDRLKLIRSEDGSHTVKSERYSATYHSLHGAIQESEHVFIKHGLHAVSVRDITILEMGFGTGLNALLTILATERPGLNVHYISLELHPLCEQMYKSLNYPDLLSCDPNLLYSLHEAPINEEVQLSDRFRLSKIQADINEYKHQHQYDLVYYDAFAPTSQPELWTKEIFSPLFEFMNPGAHLLTYCAKGVFKRMLRSIGFKVNSPAGPPGKREITQAIKPDLFKWKNSIL